ncbi:hypothetical protein SAMN05216404_106195 [Nitrosospira multiformis]|uniref:Uncharacterized protein n=1 Tax=Nitrosospira multiformis TaxID=1231 RepID=A0A1H8IV23_9PROT|nr:hypothetical protein SAMN05216404_106195 [Nitrosospira multiformis]
MTDDVIDYLRGVYEFLKSTCPNGFAEEAFPLPPSPTRAQELLLHAIESDAH